MNERLVPAIPAEKLYPKDAVYMARTDLFQTRMLGYTPWRLDILTAFLVGLLNGRTAIRHEGGAGEDVFGIYRRAGMEIAEDTLTYRTPEEAEMLMDGLIAQGKRLFSPYPLPAGRFPDASQIVPPGLYRSLNAKMGLASLVSQEVLPQRQILSHEELSEFELIEPVFLKAAGDAATGLGFAVRPCRDRRSFESARRWFAQHRDRVPAVLVEEWVEVLTCWCAGVVVRDDGTECFGGAEQIFSSPARQSGSMIDPENAFPEAGEKLAVQIGEAARKRGFRGIAGLDIGIRQDGRLVVFDPNFRVNASTTQLLYHASAAARAGQSVSCSLQARPQGRFSELAKSLGAPSDEGWFVPVLLFNGERHPLSEGKHAVTGFVLGEDRANAQEAAEKLSSILGT